jgi:hypothetical protein
MTTLERIYEELKHQKPELSKRTFSTDYLGASSGYMTSMAYYNRDVSLKALANLRNTLAMEVDAWKQIDATHNTERSKHNYQRAMQLHSIATETLLEAI